MKGLPFVLAFTAMTFIAWGAYGPLLHHGTLSMGNDSLRAFVGVGIAYFFIAVLVPIYILRSQGEAGKWTIGGTFYSLIAGSVGALGALGVILALAYGGAPIYVMPLVFGFAPIVNTLVTAWMSKTFDQISPVFIAGIVVAALGVAGVLAFKPSAPPHAAHPAGDSKADDHDDKQPSNKEHSQLDVRNSVRFVSSLVIQEPAAQDPLPPVVVQPAPPVATRPATPVVPQVDPAQPAPPPEQPVAPVLEQPELPPVVVQPSAPENKKPQADKPTAPPTADVAQEAAPQVPPTVPHPAPLPQAETKTPPPSSPVEAPKVDVAKPQSQSEPSKPESTKPEPAKPESTKPDSDPVKPEPVKPEPVKPELSSPKLEKRSAEESAKGEVATEKTAPSAGKATATPDVLMVTLSIIVAAICWGSYGPMLHQGQARMGGSRLRPFTCVGLAYFFIAVAAPLAVINARVADTGSWSTGGLSWSIVAGAAGAIGALGVILAFNAGGKPYYVMPLVFGFAPVINTCISLTEKGTWGLASTYFWMSLGVVIAGAITVLLNAPKPKHVKPVT